MSLAAVLHPGKVGGKSAEAATVMILLDLSTDPRVKVTRPCHRLLEQLLLLQVSFKYVHLKN